MVSNLILCDCLKNSFIAIPVIGDSQAFFTGSHVGEHICTCGLDNSCIKPDLIDRKCNCDAKNPAWEEDEGTITAKELLPINSVVYGPLPLPIEMANYTVGPLRCSGN